MDMENSAQPDKHSSDWGSDAASEPAADAPSPGTPAAAQATLRDFMVLNRVPPELEKLRDLGRNVWWSWHEEAGELFAELDPEHWRKSEQNPRTFLETAPPDRLDAAVQSAPYLAKLDRVWDAFQQATADRKTPTIAYFCAEYGLVNYLRLYSGGLGILAGDYLKTASDLRLPLCAVGLAYGFGYFRQRITSNAQQESVVIKNEFLTEPMDPVLDADGSPLIVTVAFPSGPVHARAWKVGVGNIDLYLLDTDFEVNQPADRAITNMLYGGDQRHRVHQELILGIGGYHMLRAVGLRPRMYHMNEGHSAFLIIARLARIVQEKGLKYHEALEYVRHTSVFTTHTPVAAGHDAFPEDVLRPYLEPYATAMHKDWPYIMALGASPATEGPRMFSMTKLAFHGSIRTNGVSKIHGAVSRSMFKDLFPGFHEEEVPVTSVTNGVHVETWLANPWKKLFREKLDPKWSERLGDADFWGRVRRLPDAQIWETHAESKARLLDYLREHVERVWTDRREYPLHITETLAALRPEALIVTFARRFAPYKRAQLLFHDLERLQRLFQPEKPLIFLFAGKAHPADEPGKALIRRVIEVSRMAEFRGRILFLENYEINMAKLLSAGSDIWLNMPTPPLEASGTSGMKAGMNGCLNVSVADGWWAEAYNGKNGWNIEAPSGPVSSEFLDAYDSARLYGLFEREILPAFFNRSAAGVPAAWVARMKESMATIIPRFATERMAREYVERLYEPALENAHSLETNHFAALIALNEQKQRIAMQWDNLTFVDTQVEGLAGNQLAVGNDIHVHAELRHPGIETGALQVQVVIARSTREGKISRLGITPMTADKKKGAGESSRWQARLRITEPGPHTLGIRVLPARCHPDHELEPFLNLVKWL